MKRPMMPPFAARVLASQGARAGGNSTEKALAPATIADDPCGLMPGHFAAPITGTVAAK